MAASRPQAQGPSMVPLALIGTVAAAGVAQWFGWPGLAILPIGLAFAAFIAPPTLLTGKKDSQGYPTAISPSEDKAMNRYRMWSELKWKSLVPSMDWLPGLPLRLWWFAALFLAVAALAIPLPHMELWWRALNALGLFMAIVTTNGALRKWGTPDDLCPGPTLDYVIKGIREKRIIIALAGGGVLGLLVFLATVVLIDRFALKLDIEPAQPWMPALALALAALTTVLALTVRTESLATWRTLVQVRAAWIPRWANTKLDPVPRLLAYETVGEISIASFETHLSLGVAAVYAVVDKIGATSDPGTKVAILESPAVDSQGQPVPGSKHPTRFRIATFNTENLPDINDPDTDVELVKLMIQGAFSWTADQIGIGRWVLLDVEPLHNSTDSKEYDGGGAAWLCDFAMPDGPDAKYMRDSGTHTSLGGNANSECYMDHKKNQIFMGVLSGGADWIDPDMQKAMNDLELTDTWARRWSDILKMGAVQPKPEHGVFAEAKVGEVTLYRQPFVVQQGLDPLDFFKLEPKISTTLSAAPFVSVTGFMVRGRELRLGSDRHPQAFCVTWSAKNAPAKPDMLPGEPGEGPKWVLSGHINRAFDAAKLPRPEVVEAKALTDRKSSGHIWKMTLRLYQGVTIAEVRTAQQKIRQELGSEWLRIEKVDDGCVIVAGVDPNKARRMIIARPEQANRDYMTSLDWEQAFSDSKVVGAGGLLPKLTRTATLPNNDQVQVLDFKLPTGTDRSMVKYAVPKLQASTGNAFVEVRASPDGADSVRMLISREHPLPSAAGVDWDIVDVLAAEGKLPFATGIEGEPVFFDPKGSPHALIAGASGGGKVEVLSALIPTPVTCASPTGWTKNEDLRVGDFIYAPDGTLTTVVGFSDVSIEPVYEVEFSDGQVVEVGANHLWKASSAASRSRQSPTKLDPRNARLESFGTRATALRALASEHGTGPFASLESIGTMAGFHPLSLHQIAELKALATPALIPTTKLAKQYDGASILRTITKTIDDRGHFAFAGTKYGHDDVAEHGMADLWLSNRELAELFVGSATSRDQRDSAKGLIRRSGAESREGFSRMLTNVYPVDEVLMILADRIDYQSTRGSGGEVIPLETIVDTKTMFESLRRETAARSELNWAVRLTQPIQGETESLPVDSYVLGAWLGDGSTGSGGFTGIDPEITDEIRAAGFVVTDNGKAHYIRGLIPGLRAAGVLDNKHIPPIYLRASVEQRLALLQGLMDTDGHCAEDGGSEIDLCHKPLADGVLELIRSLGIRVTQRADPAKITEADPDNPGKTRQRETSTRYRMKFTTDLPIFRLPRKLARLPKTLRSTQQWNYVTDIRVRDAEPMRCIKVDHPEHLYLTHGFIPTHNSVSLQVLIYPAAVSGADIYVIDPTKGGADFLFVEPYAKAFAATIDEGAAVMKAVYAEVVRRKNLNAEYGVGGYRELPENVRPPHIYLLMDEFTSLMQADPVSKNTSDDPEVERERELLLIGNQKKAYIGTMTGKVAREARSAGVTLFLATQKLSAAMLNEIPGAADLKTNLARMLMGNATFGEKQSALKNAMEAPELGDVIPKGRGLWESTEANARLMQVWFEGSQTTFAEKLAERREPLRPDEKLDISLYMDKSAEDKDKEPVKKRAAPSFAQAPEIIEVGAFEFSLDDLDLDGTEEGESGDDGLDWQIPMAPTTDAEIADAQLLLAPAPMFSLDELNSVDDSADDVEDDLDWDALTGYSEAASEPVGSSTSVVICWPDSDIAGVADAGEVIYLPEPGKDEPSVFGWPKLDLVVEALTERPSCEQVIWVDAEIFDEDEIGITYAELVEDVLADMGIAATFLTDAPAVVAAQPVTAVVLLPPPVPPALPPAPAFEMPVPRAPAVVAPEVLPSEPEAPVAQPEPEVVPEPAVTTPVPSSTRHAPVTKPAVSDGFDEPTTKGRNTTVFDDLF